MFSRKLANIALGVLLLSFTGSALAFDYVGSNKCKMCHKKEEKGNQWGSWKNGPHAKSYETLLTDESKAIATKKGLKVPPEQAPECLKCHVTGWEAGGYTLTPGDDAKAIKKNENLKNVTCEACHGPGSKFKSSKTMKAVWAGETKPEEVGLTWVPQEDRCVQCHNEESPTYKPFKYEERIKKVAHPYPNK